MAWLSEHTGEYGRLFWGAGHPSGTVDRADRSPAPSLPLAQPVLPWAMVLGILVSSDLVCHSTLRGMRSRRS